MTTQRRSALGAGRNTPRWQGEGLALAAARTVMVCGLRKPQTIGYEMLPVGGMIKTAFVLLFASSVLNFPLIHWLVGNLISRGDDPTLRLFAVAFLGLGLWLRRQRKREKWDPSRPHRYDPGISWFTFLKIREDYVYRFVDPGVGFLAGAVLRYKLGCPMLGLWWMIAGCALAMVEWNLHQRTEEHDWQLGDGPKEAARDAEAMKAMSDRKESSEEENPVTTGLDDKLAAEIALRRKREGEVNA